MWRNQLAAFLQEVVGVGGSLGGSKAIVVGNSLGGRKGGKGEGRERGMERDEDMSSFTDITISYFLGLLL